LKDANQKGPHWADPLKAWGDVLLKQGKTKAALVKYDEALKYAPNWNPLKEARAGGSASRQSNQLFCFATAARGHRSTRPDALSFAESRSHLEPCRCMTTYGAADTLRAGSICD
jgi:hypothetical protein